MITARAFAGKHYAVYGLARSGLATVEALLASGARVTAWDAKEDARAGTPARTEIANLDEIDLSQFDSLVVTPGLPLNRHPIAQRARDAGVEIIGDIELFARARPELPPHKVVGITGTNGKSTTTALVHHILQTAGVPTTMGGNIGLPILAQDPLPEGGVHVLELSSYQLDLTQSLDCDVAVLLNITPDHLDRYGSLEAYQSSKVQLLDMQQRHQRAFVGVAVLAMVPLYRTGHEPAIDQIEDVAFTIQPELSPARRFDSQEDVTAEMTARFERWNAAQATWPALQGPHNAQNSCAAIAICRTLGVHEAVIEEGLRTYRGLPHRMERVRDKDGVTFVNDSKATNPTATAPALAAFEKIRWICGGQAKTDSLDECAPHFGHVRKAYTIGEAGELFASLLSPHMAVAECQTLERAVGEAAAEAESGDTVLLSPACASFDQFRDFEDRGDQFRQLVGAL
ncbi:UDP-N-acetylmuramoyl-L-alanine--D-glutamate ligase [Sphingomonas sp. URHD0057]|uniref:UDP-N-acetylmuramoyl-L-alanine--D-glutamate ligase n=1 Tax=Sphingomonas sp. URHD0057 TaxID=1380389 RepID=UPI00048A57B7|nr:UDP-N-acetylmuramoyl-L-alanine--D-glutamate ligase [Sphingomonas sp. URHD0057]